MLVVVAHCLAYASDSTLIKFEIKDQFKILVFGFQGNLRHQAAVTEIEQGELGVILRLIRGLVAPDSRSESTGVDTAAGKSSP